MTDAPRINGPKQIHRVTHGDSTKRRYPDKHRRPGRGFELLEPRQLLASVSAGADQAIRAASIALLDGNVTHDSSTSAVTTQWSLVSGPGKAAFVDAGQVDTAVAFSAPGTYVLRLEARGTTQTVSDDVVVTADPQGALVHGVWMSAYEVMQLPTTGAAWEYLVSVAARDTGSPNIADMDDNSDVFTLAKALVGVRTGNVEYLNQVRANVRDAMGSEEGGPEVAVARAVAPYLISADLVGLDSSTNAQFRTWLDQELRVALHEPGYTIQTYHATRPNNHGAMAGGSRAAIAVYLGDAQELARTAQVLKGWMGDRSSYDGFRYYIDLSWQADPSQPVGINPVGATKNGHDIGGTLPEEMRRGDSYQWPPVETGYPWEALQGIVVASEILSRAGYDAWNWEDQAIRRAVDWLYRMDWVPTGDDQWIPWLIDARYGTDYATNAEARPGKIMGWTAWTHPSADSSGPSVYYLSTSLGGSMTNSDGSTLRFSDADIVRLNVDSSGYQYSLYFDGSDVGLNSYGEDVSALVVESTAAGNPQLYLATVGGFSVDGLSGTARDVFLFTPAGLGATTSGSFSPTLAFQGSRFGLSSIDLDGFYFAPAAPVLTSTLASDAGQASASTTTTSQAVHDAALVILTWEGQPRSQGSKAMNADLDPATLALWGM